MDNKKNHITSSEDYQRYLDGSMTPKERHDFEKQLLDDAFESDALEGFSELESGELSIDLDQLSKRIEAKSERSSRLMYWRIAASILILAVFSFTIYYMIDVNTSPEVAQSKQGSKEEETTIAHEERSILSDSAVDEPEPIIAYQQKAEEMNEEELLVSTEEPQREKEQISGIEEIEELDVDIVEVDDEVIVEEYIEVMEEPATEKLALADEPTATELDIIEAHEEKDLPTFAESDKALIEEAPTSESIVGRAAGVRIQSSKKAPNRAAEEAINSRTITGKIYSNEDDEVIPGVNVVVKGTSIGTISDIDGNYKIDVPKNEDVTLFYSYIGLNSEEIQVKDQENIDVNMEPDLTSLSEIVVTGYGTSNEAKEKPYSYLPPHPVGGNGKFKDYIIENIRYPDSGIAEKIKGIVKLKFLVGTDGQISNLEILKSLGEDFDKEAIRLLREGPDWEPAIENDSTVVREVKLKIRFRPEK